MYKRPSYDTKVVLDYVATRDIVEGEELFLDYGDVWESEWTRFVDNWKLSDLSLLNGYVSSAEFNRRHGEKPLLTTDEQLLNPYPDNLVTRCHWLVGDSKRVFTGNFSELSIWDAWNGDNAGYQCDILSRDYENDLYSVRVVLHDRTSKRVLRVPRKAIKFADKPYSK